MFQPAAGEEICISGNLYRIAPHPAAPQQPYGQEGRQAVVYKLESEDGYWALKVFKPRYRRPSLINVARAVSRYAPLPGMAVCERTIIRAEKDMELLRSSPDLAYAALMPWVEGPTWVELLLSRRQLEPQTSLVLAKSLLQVLVALEEEGLSHGDLSAPNIVLPFLNGGSGIALVDIEQMYVPGIEKPETLTGGSPGYAFKNSPDALWGPLADRFAGSIIVSEMLCSCDKRVASEAYGESFFSEDELGKESDRYHLLLDALKVSWGAPVAGLFRLAWLSDSLEDCPPFLEWLLHLPKKAPLIEQPAAVAEVTCRTCNHPSKKSARFCIKCGSRLPANLCPVCHSEMKDGRCMHCGAPASHSSCRACGGVLILKDKYCRECGALAVHKSCAICGNAIKCGERYCGKCGSPAFS